MTGRSMLCAVKALLTCEGKVLLVRRSLSEHSGPGVWECPGGKIEFGEDPQQALLREIKEETGLQAEPGPILYASSAVYGSTQLILITYRARALSQKVTLSEEHCDYLWATKSQLRATIHPDILQELNTHRVLARLDIDE